VYARNVAGKKLTFDFAEGLINDNLLFVDRETRTIWSQLDGKAVSGTLKDTPLTTVPAIQTTWKHWRELHPDTRVLTVPGEKGYRYLYRNRKPGSPRPKARPKTHDTSALGLGLVINDDAVYYPFDELQQAGPVLQTTVGGEDVTIHYREDAPSAWATKQNGQLLPGVLCYRDGWLAFFPKSTVFSAEKKETDHD